MRSEQRSLTYYVLNMRVCREAYATLHLMGVSPRLRSLVQAVMAGKTVAPIDKHFLKRSGGTGALASHKSGEVFSYLTTLYESVAERLPEDDQADAAMAESEGEHDSEAEQSNVVLLEGDSKPAAKPTALNRYLPPGSVYDEWKQYLALGNVRCGFELFLNVWKTHFPTLLFRGKRQHAMCATCVRHKLLLSCMPHAAARHRQRLLYDRHLADQFRDRQVYWRSRAESRTQSSTLCIIIDSIDQAKFAWPRGRMFKSKQFDSFHRPRLHITACITHGHSANLYISHSDVQQSGSTTVEVLADTLTRLKEKGAPGLDAHYQF